MNNQKIVVNNCRDCPFCRLIDKEATCDAYEDIEIPPMCLAQYYTEDSPEWCPLREGNIELELKV